MTGVTVGLVVGVFGLAWGGGMAAAGLMYAYRRHCLKHVSS